MFELFSCRQTEIIDDFIYLFHDVKLRQPIEGVTIQQGLTHLNKDQTFDYLEIDFFNKMFQFLDTNFEPILSFKFNLEFF